MICNNNHRYDLLFGDLPLNQGGNGRHKCAGCAYEQGFLAGLRKDVSCFLDLSTLPESQAGSVRHKSPREAFALGLQNGLKAASEAEKQRLG